MDPWYRYHANLGTFDVHRWLKTGANRDNLADLQRGRDQIARAIEINPNAHFGRETYQLQIIETLLDPPPAYQNSSYLSTLLDQDRSQPAAEATEGLLGLIVLGDPWRSVDIFYALAVVLRSDRSSSMGRSSLSHLAILRGCELIDDGESSLIPGSPTGSVLKQVMQSYPKAFPAEPISFEELDRYPEFWDASEDMRLREVNWAYLCRHESLTPRLIATTSNLPPIELVGYAVVAAIMSLIAIRIIRLAFGFNARGDHPSASAKPKEKLELQDLGEPPTHTGSSGTVMGMMT